MDDDFESALGPRTDHGRRPRPCDVPPDHPELTTLLAVETALTNIVCIAGADDHDRGQIHAASLIERWLQDCVFVRTSWPGAGRELNAWCHAQRNAVRGTTPFEGGLRRGYSKIIE